MGALLLASMALLALPAASPAQDSEQLLFTVGTTGQDAEGDAFGYVVLQAQRAEAIIGRPYAIYEKAADFATEAPFQLRAVIQLQTNPQTIRSILNASAAFDREFAQLEQRVDGFFEDLELSATGPDGAPLDLAEKVSLAVRSAQANPERFEGLYFLGRLHPGINVVLGLGYFGDLSSPLATWEIREWDPASGVAEDVVGRVLLDTRDIDPALGYAPLPAPGRPVDVDFPESATTYNNDPRGHLNVRLRWPISPALREQSLLALGYDVFRLPADLAVEFGYADEGDPESRPIPLADVEMLVDGGLLVQTNVFPVMPESDLSAAEAYDASDTDTFFVADDDDRFEPDAENTFADGDEFFYFVAARDLLRRSGELSPGQRVIICDRMPPSTVDEVQVRNFFRASTDPAEIDAFGGEQHLEVRWRQLTVDDLEEDIVEALEDPADALDEYKYYIYRWDSPQQMLAEAANPLTNLVAGPIAHDSSSTWGSWIDRPSAGNPDSPEFPDDAGRTFYYTVRVEDASACGGNLSGNSGPVYGVLRDRRPLENPTGSVETRCLELEIEFLGVEFYSRNTEGAVADPAVRVAVRRDDPSIDWASIDVDFGKTSPRPDPIDTNRRYFSGDGNFVIFDILPEIPFQELRLRVFGGDRFGDQASQLESTSWNPDSSQGVEFLFGISYVEATDAEGTPITDCGTHRPVDRSVEGGRITGPVITGSAGDPRAREFKLYRRINDGELSLIRQGESADIFDSLEEFSHEDLALPNVPRSTICYFAQTADEHGNTSAMSQIGECIEVLREYAAPLLDSPELYTGPGGEAMARLTWYCPPAAVERFEVWVAAESGDDPGGIGADLPELGRSSEIAIDGEPGTYHLYQTRRVPGPFGLDAPEFSVDLELDPDESYRFYVRAVSEGMPDSRMAGPFSNRQLIAWTEGGADAGPDLAWPDRDLPGLLNAAADAAFNGPFAMELLTDPISGVPYPALCLGEYTLVDPRTNQVITTDDEQQSPIGAFTPFLMPDGNPTTYVSRRIPGAASGDLSTNQSIFPFALYRYRLDAPVYRENASSVVEQATPMMLNIAYEGGVIFDIGKDGDGDTIPVSRIRDPFFETRIVPGNETAYSGSGPSHRLYLKTDSPSHLGATYQYLVVFFTERGEVDTIFPLNPITVEF
jgi:hypothetical protein